MNSDVIDQPSLSLKTSNFSLWIIAAFPEDPIIEISTPFILGKEAEVTCSIPKVYPSDRLEMSLKIGEKLIGERNFFEDPDTQFLQTKNLKVLFTPTEGERGKDITCIAELPIHDMDFKPKKRQNTHILNIAGKYMEVINFMT